MIITNKCLKCSFKGKRGGSVDDVGVYGVIKFGSLIKYRIMTEQWRNAIKEKRNMQKQNGGLILDVKTCETHELPKSQGKDS